MKTILKWTVIVLGGLIGLSFLAGVALYPGGKEKLTRAFPEIPVEHISISTDPGAVTRGRHIAIIRGCTRCHGEDLGGTLLANDPFLGTIPASNLTSGKGGVASSYTHIDWIRAIRHGVKPDSRVEVLMYNYSTLSDQDLGDLIAYLQQIPPVDSDFPALRIGPVIPLAPGLGLFTPAAEVIDHSASRPADPAPGATIEYGRYLSTICVECHGSSVAGKLDKWTQDDFISAIHTGVLPNGKKLGPTMSLQNFRELNDMELSALWLYFMDSRP